MTKKRRYPIFVAILIIACVIVVIVVANWPRPAVTRANYDRIEEGMTREEVELQIGPPDSITKRGLGTYLDWQRPDNASMFVVLDDDEKVDFKAWRDSDENNLENGKAMGRPLAIEILNRRYSDRNSN